VILAGDLCQGWILEIKSPRQSLQKGL